MYGHAEVVGAVLPHVLFMEITELRAATVLTKLTLDIGFVVLMVASLSFLGLGVQPPTPDLGSMVADSAKYIPDAAVADDLGLSILRFTTGARFQPARRLGPARSLRYGRRRWRPT